MVGWYSRTLVHHCRRDVGPCVSSMVSDVGRCAMNIYIYIYMLFCVLSYDCTCRIVGLVCLCCVTSSCICRMGVIMVMGHTMPHVLEYQPTTQPSEKQHSKIHCQAARNSVQPHSTVEYVSNLPAGRKVHDLLCNLTAQRGTYE